MTTGEMRGKSAGAAVWDMGKLRALQSVGGPMLKQASLPTVCTVPSVNRPCVLSLVSTRTYLTQETYKPKQTKLTSVQRNLAKSSITNPSQNHR